MTAWSAERAEEYLLSLELFGMRFGLDRMNRLMTALGRPQEQFASIHVVGTNGKSSTARMIAAILERHGKRTGTYLSPHLGSFAERVRIGDADLEPEAFGAAVQRAAHAAELVNRTLAEDDRVTQFEALTAAAYSELAARGVEVAVIEAGLGGRYDATNVIPSSVQVLTNVGLEHTRWLGPTIADIAREKLAVVRGGGTLVVGALEAEAEAEAEKVVARQLGPSGPCARRSRRRLLPRWAASSGATSPWRGRRRRRSWGRSTERRSRRPRPRSSCPGRLQPVGEDPLTLLDGAHNPSGLQALAESLPDVVAARSGPLVAVVSILEDKDAAAMLRELLPHVEAVVFTRSANPRALSPATLESLWRQLGGAGAEIESDPKRAVERARALAGAAGSVLVTGSIYLVADLLREPSARRASMM